MSTSTLYNFISLTTFEETVDNWLAVSKSRKIITIEEYNKIKTILTNPNEKIENANYRYWAKKKFALQTIGNNVILLIKYSNKSKKNDAINNEVLKPVLVKEKLYKEFCEAHLQNNHGGQSQTWLNIKNKWGGIKQDLIELLVKKCVTCLSRNNSKQVTIAGKPIIARSFMSRLQVIFEIIFYFILIYN
jgi:hypothetical protein